MRKVHILLLSLSPEKSIKHFAIKIKTIQIECLVENYEIIEQ